MPSVRQTLSGFRRPVWFLLLGTFINRFGTFVIPFLTLHLGRLGYSARQSALALSAYGAGHLLASALGGHLADTIGRRRTILVSLFANAAGMLLLSQARGLGWLVALAFLTGLTGEFYRPASSALLADLVPANQRVIAFATYRFAINAGWTFGPAVGGFLARRAYFWLFLGDAATSAAFGLIALCLLPRDAQEARLGAGFLGEAVGSLKATARRAWADGRFVRLVVATFMVGLVFMQMLSTLGVDMLAGGESEQVYGLVLALNGALIVLGEIPLSGWTQRLPMRPVMAAGFALIGLGTTVYAWADASWQYALGMAISTGGEMLSMPVALAYLTQLAPEAMRGRYLGLYGLTWAAALACGPSLGMAVHAWQPAALWLSCGVVGATAAWVIAGPLRGPSVSRKTAARPTEPGAGLVPPP
jgi:MFS family permease